MKRVNIRIHRNISARCGVREEGCRVMAKLQGQLECISCILVVTQVDSTKLEWLAPASWGELLELSIATRNTMSGSDVYALMILLSILPHIN